MADASDSNSLEETHVGSTPTSGTYTTRKPGLPGFCIDHYNRTQRFNSLLEAAR